MPHRFTAENKYEVKAEVTPPLRATSASSWTSPRASARSPFRRRPPTCGLSLIGPDKDPLYPCPFELHGQPNACAVARPQPGVWEINVVNNGVARNFDPAATIPLKAFPVTVTARIVGVNVKPAASSAAAPAVLSLQNRLAKVAASAAGAEVGSARRQRGSIAQGGQSLSEVLVPKGATSLRARVEKVSDSDADLDVYLLDCTEPEKPKEEPSPQEKEKGNKSPAAAPPMCGTAAKAADVGAGGEAVVYNPKPGRWVVAVDGFRVPGGTVSYELVDVFTHPSFGAVAVIDSPDDRAPEDRWTVKASTLAGSPPEPSRRLEARVIAASKDVTTTTGAFGQGDRVPLPLGARTYPSRRPREAIDSHDAVDGSS